MLSVLFVCRDSKEPTLIGINSTVWKGAEVPPDNYFWISHFIPVVMVIGRGFRTLPDSAVGSRLCCWFKV